MLLRQQLSKAKCGNNAAAMAQCLLFVFGQWPVFSITIWSNMDTLFRLVFRQNRIWIQYLIQL